VDHRVTDDLEQVPVAGEHGEALLRPGGGGDRADDVVGLVAGGLGHRQAGRVQHLQQHRDLAGQLGRVLGPLGLVAGVQVDPPLGPPVGVEDVGHGLGAAVDQDPRHHVQVAADGVHRVPVRPLDRGRQGEERPVEQAGRVDHESGQPVGHRVSMPHRCDFHSRWVMW
jgi:hypothetical protein